MNLDFKSMSYVVFDEADRCVRWPLLLFCLVCARSQQFSRLFEMGFAAQLHDILYRLPGTRQTLLFSATLPKTLIDFANAGLQNPKLIRLDADSKISADLRMAFFSVKPSEKEAALLCLLRDIIHVPQVQDSATSDQDANYGADPSKKRKRVTDESTNDDLAPYQTLVFVATKHHVEYLSALLIAAGYRVAQIYGSLDPVARRQQLASFRTGRAQILCVTDLAARGIDIPLLENVVNYDFPIGARSFIHRVGRTARAGRKGWAFSFITHNELAHLLDLELFLSRPVRLCSGLSSDINLSENLVLGTLPRERIDSDAERVRSVLVEPSPTLQALQSVAERGQRMYERSQTKASAESYRRAKDLIKSGTGLAGSVHEDSAVHPVFDVHEATVDQVSVSSRHARISLLQSIKSFQPTETVFEIGNHGKNVAAQVMRDRRRTLAVGKIDRNPLSVALPTIVESIDGDVKFDADGQERALEVWVLTTVQITFLIWHSISGCVRNATNKS